MKKFLIVIAILFCFGTQNFAKLSNEESYKLLEEINKENDENKKILKLKKAVVENQKNAELSVTLGVIYDLIGNQKESEKYIKMALETQNKYPILDENGEIIKAELLIGMMYSFFYEPEKAIKWFEEVKKTMLNKEYQEAINILIATEYKNIGNEKEAIKQNLEIIKNNKKNGIAYGNLGYIYYELNDLKKAKQYLEKAKELLKKEEQIEEIRESIKKIEIDLKEIERTIN